MSKIFHPLLFLLARSTTDDLQKQIEFLRAENEMLRTRVLRKRIFLKEDERSRLLKLGEELGPAIRHLITIVGYSTFRRWVRRTECAATKSAKGRPRITKLIREVVVQIANETCWGYSRILGELRKLNLGRISRQSVKSILVEHDFYPGPKRDRGSWSEFLKVHAETLWQVDFFSKMAWTATGRRQVFAMVFLHIDTRRIFVTPATFKPDASWMEAQAHAFLQYTAEQKIDCKILIRDRDGKFSSEFTSVFTDRGVQVKPVGPRAPYLNAFVERWIQSLKHEALDHFMVMGLAHFDHIVIEYVTYYHERRPHQGIGNSLIGGEPHTGPSVMDLQDIKCESRLGGLLKHYYRAA